MKREKIIESLTEGQRSLEKRLRTELLKEFKKYQRSRYELRRLLLQLHDEVIGEKRFKEYLELVDIPRRSAYRWMDAYKTVGNLPEEVLKAAERRNIDLGLGKYQDALKEFPMPEGASEAQAEEWLDKVEASQKGTIREFPDAAGSTTLAPEDRRSVTGKVYLRHCRQVIDFTNRYWGEIPAEERKLEVVRSLMGAIAAKLGISEPFTVEPDPETAGSNRLLERLEEKAGMTDPVEEKSVA